MPAAAHRSHRAPAPVGSAHGEKEMVMHAISKGLVLLSVIFLPIMLINTDKLHNADNNAAASLNGIPMQAVPHRVDMHMLANAFN